MSRIDPVKGSNTVQCTGKVRDDFGVGEIGKWRRKVNTLKLNGGPLSFLQKADVSAGKF